jgi:hypothetical protein
MVAGRRQQLKDRHGGTAETCGGDRTGVANTRKNKKRAAFAARWKPQT